MLQRFNTVNDANMRLISIIAFYKGKPCFTTLGHKDLRDDNATQLSITDLDKVLGEQGHRKVDYTDPDFTVGFPKVGNLNTKVNCHYVESLPIRSQKWGYSRHNFFVGRDRLKESLMYSKNMEDMLLDKYPTLDEVIGKLNDSPKIHSKAFHKEFRLSRTKGDYAVIFGKNTIVGTVAKGKNTIALKKDYDMYPYIVKLLGLAGLAERIK